MAPALQVPGFGVEIAERLPPQSITSVGATYRQMSGRQSISQVRRVVTRRSPHLLDFASRVRSSRRSAEHPPREPRWRQPPVAPRARMPHISRGSPAISRSTIVRGKWPTVWGSSRKRSGRQQPAAPARVHFFARPTMRSPSTRAQHHKSRCTDCGRTSARSPVGPSHRAPLRRRGHRHRAASFGTVPSEAARQRAAKRRHREVERSPVKANAIRAQTPQSLVEPVNRDAPYDATGSKSCTSIALSPR
jgi:hypothetical protein